MFDRLRDACRASVPEHMTAIRQALAQRAWPRLRVGAHKVAGTLSAFSTFAGALALALEDAANSEDGEHCAELVGQLEAASTAPLEETRGLTLEALRP